MVIDKAKLEALLHQAFAECESAFCPLNTQQKQILLSSLINQLTNQLGERDTPNPDAEINNPLNELTSEQLQTLLDFVQEQEQKGIFWKTALLNDWVNQHDSGSVKFIREEYGFWWLNSVQPIHLAECLESQGRENELRLKVGDRIEVANFLWEWVRQEERDNPEWFPCTVTNLSEVVEGDYNYTTCRVCFDQGAEFEIQGIYEWNFYNWRFLAMD